MLAPGYIRHAAKLRRVVEILQTSGAEPTVIEAVKAQWLSMLESNDRFINDGPAIIQSIDAQGTLVAVSNKWLERFGYLRDQVIGRQSTDFLTNRSAKYAKDVVLPELMATGKCSDIPYEFVACDGTIVDVLLSSLVIYNEDGSFARSLAVIQDISPLTAQKMKLRSAYKTLEQYAYASAHDIRSPLRNIDSLVRFIFEDCGDTLTNDVAESLRKINQQISRIERLLDSMSDYTKISLAEVTTESFNLKEALSEAMANLQSDISVTGAEIVIGSVPQIHANRGFIILLFQNLIGNALKYCRAMPKIEITSRRHEDMYEITISDHGIGIEPEYAERIFEPLKRLHNYYDIPGTGLGLAICRRIVELHGGRIWLNTDYVDGAEFRFLLPVPSVLFNNLNAKKTLLDQAV